MAPPPRITSLHGRHAALGARFAPFAGWDMPLTYGSPSREHLAVRERLGIFDVSHMGQIEVGPGARGFLAGVLTNDLGRLRPGLGQYTLMLNAAGGVIDDLIAYDLDDRFLLVVNAANRSACLDHLRARAPDSVTVVDRSDQVAMLALQGRGWRDALTPLAADPGVLGLEYFAVVHTRLAGVPTLIARTGYTGEPGVELMCPWDRAPELWDALAGGDPAPVPAGLVARDTLRLEMGYPLHGNELTPSRTPIEAGLAWACDLAAGTFLGAEILRGQRAAGTAERLCAFRVDEPGIPRAGQTVLVAGEPVGAVTSGTLSPSLDAGIGMAYVRSDVAEPDTGVSIDVRGKHKAATTRRRPLVHSSPKED